MKEKKTTPKISDEMSKEIEKFKKDPKRYALELENTEFDYGHNVEYRHDEKENN